MMAGAGKPGQTDVQTNVGESCLDGLYISLNGNRDTDPVKGYSSQVVWLKVELCKLVEENDLLNSVLQALKKISREQPLACLQSGAIMAVLSYIDFFSTTVQGLIGLLSKMAAGSTVAFKALFELNIVELMKVTTTAIRILDCKMLFKCKSYERAKKKFEGVGGS